MKTQSLPRPSETAKVTLVLMTVMLGLRASPAGVGNFAEGKAFSPCAIPKIPEAYGKIPLSFEVNRGQTDESVDFLARGAGYSLFLRPQEAVFVLSGKKIESSGKTDRSTKEHAKQATTSAVLHMKLVGVNAHPAVEGSDELVGKVNYFMGDDPEKWRTNISTFSRVRYKDVYPGIDLVYYGNQQQLEYDLVVSPRVDYRQVKLKFAGANKVEIERASGDLLLHTRIGVLRQHRPKIYQEIDGKKRKVIGRYVMRSEGRIGFDVARYDTTRPLVIDPILVYSTYLGGSGAGNVIDQGRGIAVDSSGNAYIAGQTLSTDFPTLNPVQPTSGGGTGDVFVSKFNASGSALIYSTYLGGSGTDDARAIALDSSGNVYVTGSTGSANFPTANALQPTSGGSDDVFVTKLNASGSALIYSTYLGGNDTDGAFGIAVDSSGNAYVTGITFSTNFPTANAFQPTYGGGIGGTGGDVFVTKLNPAGSALVYSTYLGGSDTERARAIAVDSAGAAYITGQTRSTDFPLANPIQGTKNGLTDAFAAKLDASGSGLVYSTYLGGGNNEEGFAVAVDSSGSAYITGETSSPNFPTANPLQATFGGGPDDGFVTKLNATGSAFIYSTYLGGNGDDHGYALAIDPSGNAYITGTTASTNFPTANPFQAVSGGGGDAYVTKLNAAGSAVIFSTYLGGTGLEYAQAIAIDSSGIVYISGLTQSTDFPTQNPFQGALNGSGDAFIVKLNAEPAGNATWAASPTTGDWNMANNWAPANVPNGPPYTATFATSAQTTVTLSSAAEVDGITFVPGASAYTITENPAPRTVSLTLSGVGITNNSVITQNFIAAAVGAAGNHGNIQFNNSATAGSQIVFTTQGGVASGKSGGLTTFNDTSSASSNTFVTNGGSVNGAGRGLTQFHNSASASTGIFTNNGGAASSASGAELQFLDASTASSATVTNNGVTASGAFGAFTQFRNISTAGSATFTNNSTAISGGNTSDTEFLDSATAGNGHFINNAAALTATNGGFTLFFNSSTAANGIFTNNATAIGGGGSGRIQFQNTSTAANGAFTNNGSSANNNYGGSTEFYNTATAGSSTQTSNAGTVSGAYGGYSDFFNSSSAGNSILIANGGSGGANGGTIFFEDTSTGGTARAQMFGNGNLDITLHSAPGLTIGSIEGDGKVFLGARNLTVGSNNTTTLFSGVVQDGGYNGGTGGSLSKTGTATLTLSGANTYTGATTVGGGILNLTGSVANGAVGVTSNGQLINNGTIGGNVSVSGLLSGCGIINGTLTVNLGGIVDLVGCAVTINGAITNNGLFILGNGATLAGSSPSFTNNATLDIITAGTFTPPLGFVNNGTIIDASVVKSKAAQKAGNTMTVTIQSYTGHTYQLQKSLLLTGNSFNPIGDPQQGTTNTVLTFTDENATGAMGFYRIAVNP